MIDYTAICEWVLERACILGVFGWIGFTLGMVHGVMESVT